MPYVYECQIRRKKKPQSVDKGNDKADENDKVDMCFFKKDGLYKVLRSVGDECNVEMIPTTIHLEALDEEPYTCWFKEQKKQICKDEPRLGAFVEKLVTQDRVEADCPNPSKNKTDNLDHLCGGPKPLNSCSLCGGTDHNKRTCPGRFEDQNEVVVQKEVGQEEVFVEKEVCQDEVVQEKIDLAEDE
ncbi:hypothetical protein Tco_1483556 [Tanacetum coccineum]